MILSASDRSLLKSPYSSYGTENIPTLVETLYGFLEIELYLSRKAWILFSISSLSYVPKNQLISSSPPNLEHKALSGQLCLSASADTLIALSPSLCPKVSFIYFSPSRSVMMIFSVSPVWSSFFRHFETALKNPWCFILTKPHRQVKCALRHCTKIRL